MAVKEIGVRGRKNGQQPVDGGDPLTGESVLLFRRAGAVALPLALFAAALSFRLPYLMEVPGFTDESVEVRIGLSVLKGERPLIDVEPYLGSLFNYLVAGAFLTDVGCGGPGQVPGGDDLGGAA